MNDPITAPPVLRLVDGDAESLSRRVERALGELPDGASVAHFTYWYTGRPPLHEATVMPAPQQLRRTA